MAKNLDRGLDKRVEIQGPKDASGSKSPKTDQVKKDTAKKLSDNIKPKR